jgi:hypothetical protein
LRWGRTAAFALVAALPSMTASAQQPAQPVQQQPRPQQSAPQPQQFQQSNQWQHLPRMQLKRQFSGPLQDTIVQRWRDPVDGTTCYIYLPVSVQHSLPTATGFVQYGANTIGSISCMRAGPVQGNAPGRK